MIMQPVTDPQLADELQEAGLLWWWRNQRWVLDSAIDYDKPSSTFDIHKFAIRVEA